MKHRNDFYGYPVGPFGPLNIFSNSESIIICKYAEHATSILKSSIKNVQRTGSKKRILVVRKKRAPSKLSLTTIVKSTMDSSILIQIPITTSTTSPNFVTFSHGVQIATYCSFVFELNVNSYSDICWKRTL